MASIINTDTNAMIQFILRWTFAGVWGAVGWALSQHYVIPLLPGV